MHLLGKDSGGRWSWTAARAWAAGSSKKAAGPDLWTK